jgi:regulator of sigma D
MPESLKKKLANILLSALVSFVVFLLGVWVTDIKASKKDIQTALNERPTTDYIENKCQKITDYVIMQDNEIKITVVENKKEASQQRLDMENRFFKYIEQILKSNEITQQDVRDLKMYILNGQNKQKTVGNLKNMGLSLDSLLFPNIFN